MMTTHEDNSLPGVEECSVHSLVVVEPPCCRLVKDRGEMPKHRQELCQQDCKIEEEIGDSRLRYSTHASVQRQGFEKHNIKT